MKDRIKEMRKVLGLTQQAEADRLGVKRNTVAQWEIGINNIPDHTIKLICHEFGVREEWLRTGAGPMMDAVPAGALDELAAEYSLDDLDRRIIRGYLQLTASERAVIKRYIQLVSDSDELDIEAELASYRAELTLEKGTQAKSTASPATSAKTEGA